MRRQDGSVWLNHLGEPDPRTNPDLPSPCLSCPKPPVSAKKAGKGWRELRQLVDDPVTPQAEQLLRFHAECRAVGHYPDDPLVRWAAVVIAEERDAFEAHRAAEAEARRTAEVIGVLKLLKR